jgi:hypothetical protein
MDGERYQQLYKQIGQSHFVPEELAHNALRPLMKDAKGYGDAVVAMLGQAADEIEGCMRLPMLRELVDRDSLKHEIEQLAQLLTTDPRGKNLALNACERYIDDLDLATVVDGVRQTLIANYLMNIYNANFESIAMTRPGTTKYPISHDTVVAQLPHIREHVEGYAYQIAESIAKKLSLDYVQMPKAPRANEVVELEEVLSL